MVALLKLPDDIQTQVDNGELPATAYELVKLPIAGHQWPVAARLVTEGFTRFDAIDAVRREVEQAATASTLPLAVGTSHRTGTDAAPEFSGET